MADSQGCATNHLTGTLFDSPTMSETTIQHSCACRRPPFRFQDYDTEPIGEDRHGAEISVSICKRCGVLWLAYLIEEPHYSRSGRW